jgi:hypothetical protein
MSDTIGVLRQFLRTDAPQVPPRNPAARKQKKPDGHFGHRASWKFGVTLQNTG